MKTSYSYYRHQYKFERPLEEPTSSNSIDTDTGVFVPDKSNNEVHPRPQYKGVYIPPGINGKRTITFSYRKVNLLDTFFHVAI